MGVAVWHPTERTTVYYVLSINNLREREGGGKTITMSPDTK